MPRARVLALPPRLLGLRPRLLAALLLTSVVTLAVAALALLSPLEQRLREDGEATVKTALGASRLEFSEIRVDPSTGRLDSRELRRDTISLHRRSDAAVAVLDSHLHVVSPTPSPEESFPDYSGPVRLALSTRLPVHALIDSELVVAEPILISGRRYVVVLLKRLDYVSSAGHVVQIAFVEAAATGVLIAMLLGLGLTTRLLRRLERLRDATRELERGGLRASPLPEDRSSDEIGELARAFARMQSWLRGQEAARRAFVATASHELRTPLASLDGVLELLEDDLDPAQLDLEDARARTARAREQARTLSRLASDLLDLSRLDAEVELRSEPVELGELCRAVAAELELDASRRGVAIAVALAETGTDWGDTRSARIPKSASAAGACHPASAGGECYPASAVEPCWAQGDPGAVARIVRILLDNALRVAPPGSSVELRAAAHDGSALLTVADHGPGVAPAERELIFNRFQRGSATGGRSGFGLGLAIGRELATRMDGALELAETGMLAGGECLPASVDGAGSGFDPTHPTNPGARFQLRLPLAREDEARAHLEPSAGRGVPS